MASVGGEHVTEGLRTWGEIIQYFNWPQPVVVVRSMICRVCGQTYKSFGGKTQKIAVLWLLNSFVYNSCYLALKIIISKEKNVPHYLTKQYFSIDIQTFIPLVPRAVKYSIVYLLQLAQECSSTQCKQAITGSEFSGNLLKLFVSVQRLRRV